MNSLVVQEAHQRSKSFGLTPETPLFREKLLSYELKHTLDENYELYHTARPILEKILSPLHASGTIAILADKEGTILYTTGSLDFMKKTDRVCLQPGANWREDKRGTNAIGTALALAKPVRIHGDEHYLQLHGFLTCSACPIFSPSGEFIGVVDISAPAKRETQQALALAILAAESIENRLLWQESQKQQAGIIEEIRAVSSQSQKGLVSLNRDGEIIFLNSQAKLICGDLSVGKQWNSFTPSNLEHKTIFRSERRTWVSLSDLPNAKQISQDLKFSFQDLYSNCPKVTEVIQLAQKAASTDMPVLLLGESGTGKELVAQSIHRSSQRAEHKFIAINCSAIPESLIESELFGYAKGSFTGANKEGSPGKFSQAHQGTLFLDEIGDMPLRAQAALLRVIQEKRVLPLGSKETLPANTRIVAATHRDLWKEVQEGRFRQDLYFRLKGIVVRLIPLRERSDLIGLAKDILKQGGFGDLTISLDAQKRILAHTWPGNIRELQNTMLQAAFFSQGGEILPDSLHLEEFQEGPDTVSDGPKGKEINVSLPLPKDFESLERELTLRTLEDTEGNVTRAAEKLGIGRNTLYRRLQKWNLNSH
ncbi:sigma-54-dependent Fis family transcriptional regulator [Leptospira ryugenii]|uniref:sigma-54-dependent Fis family transcriptional regulator n=1 Tax=Leptospira ryugenii TaxID=1917863 RepID=UPI0014354B46|nr:sigma-54-dependent Fis family transcriptional regulator [Leptospira ryugenii]